MKTIHKIIVAVDFSEYSISAATYAVDLATDLAAEVLLTNVFNQRDIDMINKVSKGAPDFPAEEHINEQFKNRRERLEEMAKNMSAGDLNIETEVRSGVPYKALLQAIEEKGPDLLVMGTKGRSNFVDMIIGSCAQKMFRRSPIPVLSLRKDESEK